VKQFKLFNHWRKSMKVKSVLVKSLTAFVLTLTPLAAQSATASADIAGDAIIVSGTGQVVAEPDLANVDMSVTTRAKTVAAAQSANAAASKTLVATIRKGLELPESDVRTTGYSVNPEYRDQSNNRILIGYVVTHSLLVTLRDISKVGTLLDLAGGAGATELGTVSFGTSKQKEYQLQALSLAVADARTKADVIAQTTGRAVTRVVKVTADGYQVQAKQERADQVRESTTIWPGQIVINSSVTVEFEF
jgi:uncharacterized protein YggE